MEECEVVNIPDPISQSHRRILQILECLRFTAASINESVSDIQASLTDLVTDNERLKKFNQEALQEVDRVMKLPCAECEVLRSRVQELEDKVEHAAARIKELNG